MDGMRKSMDRLRRSIRQSFRKKPKKSPSLTGETPVQPPQWQSDEAAVRAGNCSFSVKYLGSTEVFESRGMQICEEALKQLRNSNRKSQRAVLHISGDGLRVVDATSSQLIVDQTIEKVSFCAPDRNHDRGFSYICRDGTTRRWLCHGFVAVRESGERLSHAVGCAFQICLEKKQKRDREAAAQSETLPPDIISVHSQVKSTPTAFPTPPRSNSVIMSSSTTSNNHQQLAPSSSSWLVRQSSTRSSIAERMKNPQEYKAASPPPPPSQSVVNPHMRDRPHVTPEMLQRQQSLRVFPTLKSATPFKRNMSLETRNQPESLASIRWRQTSLDIPTVQPSTQHVTNPNVPTWDDGSPILDPVLSEEPEEITEEVSRLCQQMSFDLNDMSSNLTLQENVQFQRYTTSSSNGPVTHYSNLPKSVSSPVNLERRSESAREARQRFAERSPLSRGSVHPPSYVNGLKHNSINIKHPLTVDWNASTVVHDPFNADWVNVHKNGQASTNPFLT